MENKEKIIEEAVENKDVDNTANEIDYKKIVEDQNKYIESLVKQTELNKKINEQLKETINEKLTEKKEEKKNPYEWIDNIINGDVSFNAPFSEGVIKTALASKASNDFSAGTGVVPELLKWQIKYLHKEEKLNNEQIYNRLNSMLKFMDKGITPIEFPE